MTVIYRPFAVAFAVAFAGALAVAALLGFALANGCGRTEMDLLANVSGNAGWAAGGQTGSGSRGAGGGAGWASKAPAAIAINPTLCIFHTLATCLP